MSVTCCPARSFVNPAQPRSSHRSFKIQLRPSAESQAAHRALGLNMAGTALPQARSHGMAQHSVLSTVQYMANLKPRGPCSGSHTCTHSAPRYMSAGSAAACDRPSRVRTLLRRQQAQRHIETPLSRLRTLYTPGRQVQGQGTTRPWQNRACRKTPVRQCLPRSTSAPSLQTRPPCPARRAPPRVCLPAGTSANRAAHRSTIQYLTGARHTAQPCSRTHRVLPTAALRCAVVPRALSEQMSICVQRLLFTRAQKQAARTQLPTTSMRCLARPWPRARGSSCSS